MPLNLSPFCASLGNRRMWRFCRSGQFVTPDVHIIFTQRRKGRRKDAKKTLETRQRFASLRLPLRLCVKNISWHAHCGMQWRTFGKGKSIMKTVVSFLLGAVMLFGAATLGLQSATANAKDKHDKNYWKHHHHRHHKHHRNYKNHLSY